MLVKKKVEKIMEMKYQVFITRKQSKWVEVSAGSKDRAEAIVRDRLENGEICFENENTKSLDISAEEVLTKRIVKMRRCVNYAFVLIFLIVVARSFLCDYTTWGWEANKWDKASIPSVVSYFIMLLITKSDSAKKDVEGYYITRLFMCLFFPFVIWTIAFFL